VAGRIDHNRGLLGLERFRLVERDRAFVVCDRRTEEIGINIGMSLGFLLQVL
jgi:hypothetical protein